MRPNNTDLGRVDEDRARLSRELQDLLNYGSARPEIMERVVSTLYEHAALRTADDSESIEHFQSVCDCLRRLNRAVRPRQRTAKATVNPARTPLRCPSCRAELDGVSVRGAGRIDLVQCPACGTCLGVVPADTTSQADETPYTIN